MSVFDYIETRFPDFRMFLKDEPQWYLEEMDYQVARRLLDYAVMLNAAGRNDDLSRLFTVVEDAFEDKSAIADALCIDFVQPIADIGTVRPVFVRLLGPLLKTCYDAQF